MIHSIHSLIPIFFAGGSFYLGGRKLARPARGWRNLNDVLFWRHLLHRVALNSIQATPHAAMSSQSPAGAQRQAASDVGEGWTLEEVTRKGGKTAGTKDKYWYSPAGKKFRSRAEIGRFKDALATLVGTDEEGDEDKAWKLFKGGGGGSSAKKKSTPSSSSAAKSKTAKAKSPSSTSTSSAKKKANPTGTASSSKNQKAASTTSAKKKKAAAKVGQVSISDAFAAAAAAASKQKKKRPAADSDGDDGEEKKEDEDMVMATSSSAVAKVAGSPKKKGRKMVARKSQKAGKPAPVAAEKVRVGSSYCLLHGIVILLHLSDYLLRVCVQLCYK